MKAAIYTRVSTPGQVQNGESLEMQKEELLEYIRNKKWELYKIYEDGGFSGGTTKRPAFQEMLRDAESKRFDVIVVYKIDRLSRTVLDFHKTMEIFKKHSIEFVSLTQAFNTTDAPGRLMLNMLVEFANFEREINIDRARDSYLNRLKGGFHSGRTPYGYKRNGKQLTIIQNEADKVKEIFSLALQGLSTSKIAEKLEMDYDHVKSIITNPFYTGYVSPRRDKYGHRIQNKDAWYKGQHEGIISLETYLKVSEKRTKKTSKTRKNIGLFSKLIYCPYCNHNLSLILKKMPINSFYVYICRPVEIKGKCCNQYVREEFLETLLVDHLDSLFKIELPQIEKDDPEKELNQIDKNIKRAVELLDNSDIAVEDIKKKLESLNKQRAELLTRRIVQYDYPKINEKFKVFKALYPYMTREERKRLWNLTIEKIVAYKDEFEIRWTDKRVLRLSRKRKKPLKNVVNRRGKTPSSPPDMRTLANECFVFLPSFHSTTA